MKKFMSALILLPTLAMGSAVTIEAETSAYSNFIWRGTTFSENRPVIQGILEVENKWGMYLGAFVSNAEFSDEGLSDDATVTQETDVTIGKRWKIENWELQASYNTFYFPGAGVFDTDEFNLQAKYNGWVMELSYMDDYFGYHSTYKYARLGYEWEFKQSLSGALFVGYNSFNNPKGSLKSRCLDKACSEQAFTTTGAGNPDYIDIYQVTSKTLDGGINLELAFNVTNRKEYEASGDGIALNRAKDFAIITGVTLPFSL